MSILPRQLQCRQSPAFDAGRVLQPFRCLARQCSPVNIDPLPLPGIRSRGEHRAFARTREADNLRQLLLPKHMGDGRTLFLAQLATKGTFHFPVLGSECCIPVVSRHAHSGGVC